MCVYKASMLTPLVSPAMTPSSFNYNLHHHPKSSSSNDIDFSPLSSPAIMPQMNPNRYPQNPLCPEQQHRYTTDVHDNYETLTANQICEQYEQLEQAKLLITQRLSELQKNQKQHYTNTSSSSSPSVSLVYDKHGKKMKKMELSTSEIRINTNTRKQARFILLLCWAIQVKCLRLILLHNPLKWSLQLLLP